MGQLQLMPFEFQHWMLFGTYGTSLGSFGILLSVVQSVVDGHLCCLCFEAIVRMNHE